MRTQLQIMRFDYKIRIPSVLWKLLRKMNIIRIMNSIFVRTWALKIPTFNKNDFRMKA